MKLRQAKAVGVLDHHDGSVGDVDADFDHRGGDKNFNLARLKFAHHVFFFVGIKPPMQQPDMKVGKNLLPQLPVHLLGSFQFAFFVLLNYRINDVSLMSCGDLLANEIPNFGRALVGHRASDNRRASRRKLVEHGDIEVAVESEG